MVELDLSFVSFLALALILGFVAGYSIRGLRQRRIEDMLLFFRQRDQEQDRKISLLDRDLSNARGRALALRAEQVKSDKTTGDLRTSLENAQLEITRLREELSAPPAEAPPELPEAGDTEPAVEVQETAESLVVLTVQETAEVDAPKPEETDTGPAEPTSPPASSPSAAPPASAPPKAPAGNKKRPKRGRLP